MRDGLRASCCTDDRCRFRRPPTQGRMPARGATCSTMTGCITVRGHGRRAGCRLSVNPSGLFRSRARIVGGACRSGRPGPPRKRLGVYTAPRVFDHAASARAGAGRTMLCAPLEGSIVLDYIGLATSRYASRLVIGALARFSCQGSLMAVVDLVIGGCGRDPRRHHLEPILRHEGSPGSGNHRGIILIVTTRGVASKDEQRLNRSRC